MKVVKVYGALRKRLGQCRFEFDVATPAQAIKALCVNFPGLEKWLIDNEKDGVGYRVAISKEKVSEENIAPLLMPFSDREVFSITPVVAGAGRGVGAILLGAALITVAILAPGVGFALNASQGVGFAVIGKGLAAGIAAAAGNIGVGLVLLGTAQLLSPQPELSSLENGKEAARLQAFTISNVVNTSRQGLPVPIAYGRVVVGSSVISSGLDVERIRA